MHTMICEIAQNMTKTGVFFLMTDVWTVVKCTQMLNQLPHCKCNDKNIKTPLVCVRSLWGADGYSPDSQTACAKAI